MPDVVADTSPLQYLHQLGLLDLLPKLYTRVLVPSAVADELHAGLAGGYDVPRIESLSWAVIRNAPTRAVALPEADLGLGEREVMALCLAEGATAILDDNMARRQADQLGITVTGTLGILLKAKDHGHIAEIRPLLDRLEQLGFRLASGTRQAVLQDANEVLNT
jgi:uncharacterized protein